MASPPAKLDHLLDASLSLLPAWIDDTGLLLPVESLPDGVEPDPELPVTEGFEIRVASGLADEPTTAVPVAGQADDVASLLEP